MTLTAERIKLSTTRSPVWSAVVATVLSLGIAALQPSTEFSDSPLPPVRAAIGAAVLGVPVLMILAAMTITGEYRTGMIRTTFMATPNRVRVLCAKAAIAAAFAGVVTAALVLASIGLARALAHGQVGARMSLAHAEAWRTVGAITLYAVLGAMLAVGLGALLRHAAAVIAVLVLLPFVVEPLLGSLPPTSERVGPYLPFVNAFAFTKVPWLSGVPPPWGPLGSLLYFTAIVAAVFIAAMIVIHRRDP